MAAQKEVSLLVLVKDLASGNLKNIDVSVKNLTNTMWGLVKANAAFSATSGLTGMATYMVKAAMDWGNAVDDIMDVTGAAGEEASKLLVIAKHTGIGVDEATGAFAKFGKAISTAKDEMRKNGEASNDMFSRLGMSLSDLENSNVYEVFQKVVEKMRDMEDGADKDRAAMELFGRSGYQLHDMLSMTQADMEKVVNKAQKMGLIFSGDTASAWENFKRQLKGVQGTGSKLAITIGNELLPIAQDLLNKADGLASAFASLTVEKKKMISTVIVSGIELGIFVTVANTARKALELLGVRAAAALGPWGLLAIGIFEAYQSLKRYNEEVNKVKSYNPKAEVYKQTVRDGKGGWVTDYYKKDTTTLSGYSKLSPEERTSLEEYQNEQDNRLYTEKELENQRRQAAVDKINVTLRDVFGGGSSTASAEKELERLQKSLNTMTSSLAEKILQETGTSYQANMERLKNEIAKMQEDINEMAAAGLDVTTVQGQLDQYGKLMSEKLVSDQKNALQNLQIDTAKIYGEISGNKIAAAETDYQSALLYIEKERQELLNKTGDEAKVSAWVAAEKQKAEQKKLQTVRDANLKEHDLNVEHNNMLAVLAGKSQAEIDRLNQMELESKKRTLDAEIAAAQNNKEKRIALEKEKYDVILKLEDVAARRPENAVDIALKRMSRSYTDWASEAESSFRTIDSSFENNIAKMLSGAQSFSDTMQNIFGDMVNEITRMMVKMWYEQTIMAPIRSWWGGIIGGILGKGGSPGTLGDASYLYDVGGFASGGIASGWSVVGENGPELVNFSNPGRVYTASQTAAALGGGNIKVNVINNTGIQTTAQVSQSVNADETVLTIVLNALGTNKMGMRDSVQAVAARGAAYGY